MRWRLLVDQPARGSWNMAVDEALVESVEGGADPALRLYRWEPACLSLGFAQPYAAADERFCAGNGVDVVRRPTGGRAVLHHLEETYSVAAPLAVAPFSHDLQASYRLVCRALVHGLRELGAPAEVAGDPEGGLIRPVELVPCFVGPASGEVVAHGRKLVGSAMRRIGGSMLQHGAILEDWDGRLQAGCLGLADDSSLRPAVVTLTELLGTRPDRDELVDALAGGFAAVLGVRLTPGRLSEAELERARLLERERYRHERWTVQRDKALPVEV